MSELYLSPEKVVAKHAQLKGLRGNFESVWQAITDYMVPGKNDIQKTSSPGEAKFNDIFDSTAITSLEELAGALHGMLTSPTSFFFGLSTGNVKLDQNDNVRKYIQECVRIMHDVLNGSNFQTEVHEYYIDLCSIGNAPLFMEEDKDEIVRFSSWPISEVLIDENSKGKIDYFCREYKQDAKALADEFPKENLPKKVIDALAAGKSDTFEVIHSVYPRSLLMNTKPSKFPFISQYVFKADKTNLHVGGYREFPLLFGRWSKLSGEKYGRGPGEKALPETKTLNLMVKTTLIGAQKAVNPPLLTDDDGVVWPIITTPGGLNFKRAGTEGAIVPFLGDTRIDFGFQMIEMMQAKIREAFFVNQLKLREGPQMTATESNIRLEQALRFLSPMLGRQQPEFLSPMVARIYGICDRRAMLPPVPQELNGVPLKITYSSVMAMAMRQSEMQNINRTFAGIAPLTSIDPKVMDNFDVDVGARYIAKLNNFPQEMLRDEDVRDKGRQDQAEAVRAQQDAIAASTEAETVSKVMTAAAKTAQG